MSMQSIDELSLDPEAMAEHAESAAKLLKALANPFRLQILCILGGSELSVGDLNKMVSLSQSALSQHLAKLRADRLVQTRREAQTIYYSITPGPAQEIIALLQEHFCPSPIS